jgi:hypothetical protein
VEDEVETGQRDHRQTKGDEYENHETAPELFSISSSPWADQASIRPGPSGHMGKIKAADFG